jgi:hypothetical protein
MLWLVRAVALAAGDTLDVARVATAPPLDPLAPVTAWPADSSATLTWDVAHSHAASEPATVHVAGDGRFLYVRFDVTQRGPIAAAQHSNDTITGGSSSGNGSLAWTDDAVWVDLWPNGSSGFTYQFEANPNGSHNEASTENTAFAPQWESRGAAHDGGYTVTMAIPLDVIHGAHAGTWRLQFLRYDRTTGDVDVWSHGEGQTNPDSFAYSGSGVLTLVAKAPLPPPRAAIYALGSAASANAGGSTSRVGADLSVPVTPTAAFYAALHPDYSNVELDQQTISPTVYQRQYSEVRPFFTQANSYYDSFSCYACSYQTSLYTPAIPTFAQGYAFEGKQGPFSLAAFDAIGDGRTDGAAALTYRSPDTHWQASAQHVVADLPGLVDETNQIGAQWSDLKYVSAYVNYANETGTDVLVPGQATVYDGGVQYTTPRFSAVASTRSIGADYAPVDGYVTHPGVAGYALYSARIWTFGPTDALASIGVSGFLDRYQGPVYGQSQSDNQVLVDVLTKSAWDLQLASGSNYWRFGDALTPISQGGGVQLTYHSGLQTNNAGNFPSHGSSPYPTTISYSTGRYGAGRLDTWLRTSTVRVGDKGTLTFTLDNTSQWFTSTPDNIQWFDGIAYAYQINRESSFAIGLRRVTGEPPIPNGGGNCIGVCSNISVAYHLRLPHEEIYAAYGNPNTLVTVPQALLKVIFYVGGQKGT